MKKFFELSIIGRKKFKGDEILKAITYYNEIKQGELKVLLKENEDKFGVFFNYSIISNENQIINKIKISFPIKNYEKEFKKNLLQLMDNIQNSKSNYDIFDILILNTLSSSLSNGIILIPEMLNLRNNFIKKFFLEEWIGMEIKIPLEIQEIMNKYFESIYSNEI